MTSENARYSICQLFQFTVLLFAPFFIGVINQRYQSKLALIPLIYYADKKWREKKHRELEELADRVSGILRSHAPPEEKEVEPVMEYEDFESPRIDASLLGTEEVDDEERNRHKSRRRER